MNVNDALALAKSLTDPDLVKVLEHADWPDAYEALQETQEERESSFYDLSDGAKFVEILEKVTLWVHDGRLWSEDNECPNGGYAWVDGEWVMGDDLDEEDTDAAE